MPRSITMRAFLCFGATLALCLLPLTTPISFAAPQGDAENQITGTLQFGNPDVQQMVPVGDRPDHSLGVAQRKGTWTKVNDIGGDKSKEGTSTETDDVLGNRVRARGVHVTTMESGDKYFVAFQGNGTLKDGVLQSEKGTWNFTGGTGKLAHITGKGTFTCAPSGDGTACNIEGTYQLAK